MTTLRHVADTDVEEIVDEAARAAVTVLDQLFPGCDNGGITSNFQGQLVRLMTGMLQGRAVDGRSSHLPQLVINDSFFGPVTLEGEFFLPIKLGFEKWEQIDGRYQSTGHQILALDPDCDQFRNFEKASDSFTSFENAAAAVRKCLERDEVTLEEAREMNILIAPVEMLDAEGYRIKDWFMQNVVLPASRAKEPDWKKKA